jgi:transcriptional regulator with XRE-family HTH domain
MSSDLVLHRDAAKATLAKNLVLARSACELTQGQLAEAAGISRATIAQMESGSTDPRLSTLVDLATAMGTSPVLLLLGEDELRALAKVVGETPKELVSEDEVDQMRRLISSGLGKQRVQAATLGATAARAAGLSAVGAAIGTALIPGIGTAIGAAIGAFMGSRSEDEDEGDKP